MAIIGVKTNLKVSVQASGTPKTSAIYTTDAGQGVQESHVQVPLGNNGTQSLGRATDGTSSNERLIKQAINTRADVALV